MPARSEEDDHSRRQAGSKWQPESGSDFEQRRPARAKARLASSVGSEDEEQQDAVDVGLDKEPHALAAMAATLSTTIPSDSTAPVATTTAATTPTALSVPVAPLPMPAERRTTPKWRKCGYCQAQDARGACHTERTCPRKLSGLPRVPPAQTFQAAPRPRASTHQHRQHQHLNHVCEHPRDTCAHCHRCPHQQKLLSLPVLYGVRSQRPHMCGPPAKHVVAAIKRHLMGNSEWTLQP